MYTNTREYNNNNNNNNNNNFWTTKNDINRNILGMFQFYYNKKKFWNVHKCPRIKINKIIIILLITIRTTIIIMITKW